jgi:hypothetical protein
LGAFQRSGPLKAEIQNFSSSFKNRARSISG